MHAATPSRLARTTKHVALALALVLCLASGAQAAIYTGSATDRAGDLGLEAGDVLPDPAVDFTRVSVRYDDVAGRVDVAYAFNRAPAADQRLNAGVGLGTIQADGSCATPVHLSLGWRYPVDEAIEGQAAVEADSENSSGTVSGSMWRNAEVFSWQAATAFQWPTSTTWNFATVHPTLVGKRYTCARAVTYVSDGVGGGGVGIDFLDSDVFELTAVGSPPPGNSPPPSVDPDPSGGPSTPGAPQPAAPAPRFGGQTALTAAKKALARRYPKAFGKRRSYAVECRKTSASRWSCSVRWRYALFVYKGRLKLVLRSDGSIATRATLRRQAVTTLPARRSFG